MHDKDKIVRPLDLAHKLTRETKWIRAKSIRVGSRGKKDEHTKKVSEV